MHFNRTQFAAKTHVRLFAVAILILVFLLSSCTGDIDLAKIFATQYNWPVTNFGVIGDNATSFNVDSIRYDSISTYKICSHIKLDSVTVLTGFVFNCWEEHNQNELTTVEERVVDTVDFRINNIYHRKTRIKTLKAKTSYIICGLATYLIGKDTAVVTSPCVSFKTE